MPTTPPNEERSPRRKPQEGSVDREETEVALREGTDGTRLGGGNPPQPIRLAKIREKKRGDQDLDRTTPEGKFFYREI